MTRYAITFLLIAYVTSLQIKEPVLSIYPAVTRLNNYECTCTDSNSSTIYLFSSVNDGRAQFSSQVTINSNLETNLTIPNMKMFQFDNFQATACVVSKNILYAIGKKIPDGNSNVTNVIVKWTLETYELLQYNQLDPSLDSEYFHDMAVDHDFRLLFAISNTKVQQLDMNCLDLLDTIHTLPLYDEDKGYGIYLSSVIVDPLKKNVYIGMTHTVFEPAPPGVIYTIPYERESLSKNISAIRVGEHFQVRTFEINPYSGLLFVSVYFTLGPIVPLNASIITFDIKNKEPKILSVYNTDLNKDGKEIFSLKYSGKNQRMYSVNSKEVAKGLNMVCQYSVNDIGELKFETCIDTGYGNVLHLGKDEGSLLYPKLGLNSKLQFSYQIAVIQK